MAIRDVASELSSAQAVTTGTITSTNVLDTRVAGGDVGVGRGSETEILITVDVAFVGGTSVDFQLQTSDAEAFGTGNKTIASTGAIVTASLIKGAQFTLKVPYGCLQYLRGQYVVVGTFSAGKVTVGVVTDSDHTRKYASGWNF